MHKNKLLNSVIIIPYPNFIDRQSKQILLSSTLLLKNVVEMLLSVLQIYAAIILVLSLLLKCCLPSSLYKYKYR
jgi:hypothetical protein